MELETPLGVAAGPHTQMDQNVIASRFIADAKIAYNLGNAFREKGQFAAAIASYKEALRLRYPTPAAVHLNMGIAYQKQGDNAAAIAAYKAYLSAAPGAANAPQIRAIVDGLVSKQTPK